MSGTTFSSDSTTLIPADALIKPLRDQMFVKPLDWEGSMHLVAIRQGRPVRGRVVAIGPGSYRKIYNKERTQFKYSDHFTPTEVKVGDLVDVGGLNAYDGRGYAFTQILIGNEIHFYCQEQDVAIVVESED